MRGREKWRWDGTITPEGWMGEGGFLCLEGPTHGEGISRDRERPLGDWRIGRECSQHFPCPLGPRGGCWGPGPKPLPSEAPSGCAEPKPCPHPPGPFPAALVLSLGPATLHKPRPPKEPFLVPFFFLLLWFCFALLLLFHLYFYFFLIYFLLF